MQEIASDDYLSTIKQLIDKKLNELALKDLNHLQLQDKVSKFVISKGFEPNLVWDELKNIKI